ncbi:MAG: hypothetical protein EA359_18295 [Balneolaceae bacterium]|nr:MAG: hypothetical protein EA359_18295 [Balneolaceae bacterium]
METLHFSITINAPKETVWHIMLGENTYREWTDVFMPGSHFVGNWNEGSKIHFLSPGNLAKSTSISQKFIRKRPETDKPLKQQK